MKKLLLPLLMIVAGFALISCGDDEGGDSMIWDFVPTGVEVYVQDAAGNDLLNEAVIGHLSDDAISLTYKGVTTGLNLDPFNSTGEKITSRMYLAIWRGVCKFTDREGRNYLYIGQWQTEENFKHDFTLTLGDKGYTMNIDHTFNFTKKDASEFKMRTKLKVDGKTVDNVDSPTVTASIIM